MLKIKPHSFRYALLLLWRNISGWKFFTRYKYSYRKRVRAKILVYLIPLYVVVAVFVTKICTLRPLSIETVTDFNHTNITHMHSDIDSLHTLITIHESIVDFASGDERVLENNLQAAENEFTDSLYHSSHPPCPIYINLALVKEAISENDVLQGHFLHSMEETQSALTLIKQAPPECFSLNTELNSKKHQWLAQAFQRITVKYDQADKGTLLYSIGFPDQRLGFHYYSVYGILIPPGSTTPCAGLDDVPKQICIKKQMLKSSSDNNSKTPKENKNKGKGEEKKSGKKKKSSPTKPATSKPVKPRYDQPPKEQPPIKIDEKPDLHTLYPHRKNLKDALGDALADSDGKNNAGS